MLNLGLKSITSHPPSLNPDNISGLGDGASVSLSISSSLILSSMVTASVSYSGGDVAHSMLSVSSAVILVHLRCVGDVSKRQIYIYK